MENDRQIEFDKKQQAKNQQQSQPQQSQMEKDPEVNVNQTQRRSELKNSISLTQYDQENQNIDLNHISPQHNTYHKLSSPHQQQHSASPSLEDTLAILNSIPPGNPREYKEREPEPKQPKLQQYAGLMEVIGKFHEIMKPIIEEEKKKRKNTRQ
ncbi:MAG: hypothetical protein EZS28_043790, partial [Streblomastix strix]